jgi:hypothetical protein
MKGTEVRRNAAADRAGADAGGGVRMWRITFRKRPVVKSSAAATPRDRPLD